jgi:hypothetical protein
MAQKSSKGGALPAPAVVQRLADVAACDTVYADIYLRRARELLGGVLSRDQYDALKRTQRDIDAAVKEARTATIQQDWDRAQTMAERAEQLRRTAEAQAALAALGAKVYDTLGVNVDPFSPGLDFLPQGDRDPVELRDGLVNNLDALVRADAPLADLYESRRTFFGGLGVVSKRAAATTMKAADRSPAELEQLAAQAAQRGDMPQLKEYLEQLRLQRADRAAQAAREPGDQPRSVEHEMYRCPVDLAAPFADDVVQRARALGFAAARTEPLPEGGPLFDYVTVRIWQSTPAEEETEREGTIRASALIDEAGLPANVSEQLKVLVAQYLRTPFINSGGARYIPRFAPEAVLIEDFPEDQPTPEQGDLLSALGLPRRTGLARTEIESALLECGTGMLQEHLRLDSREFRLVCVPVDVYSRFGRLHGWGQQQRWTHFDGYQVPKNGQLRALVGGDVRYGGLSDLVSIGVGDQREQVVARFAVIRRARQVARWK